MEIIKKSVRTALSFIFSNRRKSYLVNAAIYFGIFAIAFELLQEWGGTLMITIIPTEIKAIMAQIVYSGALFIAACFLLRFVVSLFRKETDKPSPESVAIKELICEVKNLRNDLISKSGENDTTKPKDKL